MILKLLTRALLNVFFAQCLVNSFPIGRCNIRSCLSTPIAASMPVIRDSETFCTTLYSKPCYDTPGTSCCNTFEQTFQKIVFKTFQGCENQIASVTINGQVKGGGIYKMPNELVITSLRTNASAADGMIICMKFNLFSSCSDPDVFFGSEMYYYSIYDPFKHVCCPTCVMQLDENPPSLSLPPPPPKMTPPPSHPSPPPPRMTPPPSHPSPPPPPEINPPPSPLPLSPLHPSPLPPSPLPQAPKMTPPPPHPSPPQPEINPPPSPPTPLDMTPPPTYQRFPRGNCKVRSCMSTPIAVSMPFIQDSETFCMSLYSKPCYDLETSSCCDTFEKNFQKIVFKSFQGCEKQLSSVTINGQIKGGGIYKSTPNELVITSLYTNASAAYGMTICLKFIPFSSCSDPDTFFGPDKMYYYSIYDPFRNVCCPTCTITNVIPEEEEIQAL